MFLVIFFSTKNVERRARKEAKMNSEFRDKPLENTIFTVLIRMLDNFSRIQLF